MLTHTPSTDNVQIIDQQATVVSVPVAAAANDAHEAVSLAHTWRLFVRNRRWILLAVVLGGSVMAGVSYLVTPVYQSSARVAIAEEFPTQTLGSGAPPASGDVDQLINTEMQLVQADAVLRPVAERYGLQVRSSNGELAGGQAVLPGLSVVRVPNSRLMDISYRSSDPILSAAVANAVAQSYIQHNQIARFASSVDLSKFLTHQVEQLKTDMEASYKALAAYQQQLGVINPSQKTTIVTSRLLQLNTQLADAQNERMRKEAEYRAIQSGSTGALEVSPQATALTALNERVSAAEQRMERAKTLYGPSYPEYRKAATDLDELKRQRDALRNDISHRVEASYNEAVKHERLLSGSLNEAKTESDKLNSTTFQYDQLQREAEANANLYNELNKKIREQSISAGFQSSAVRLATVATPPSQPVFPRRNLLILVGSLGAFFLALLVIFVRNLVDKRIHTTEAAAFSAGVPVLGVLPEVPKFAMIDFVGERGHLLEDNQDRVQKWEFYQECVSCVLSTVRLRLLKREGRFSVVVTSPGAGEGKSSLALHLAMANAAQGRKTLLVDADLRHPSIHRYLKMEPGSGLTQMVEDGAELKNVCRQVPELANLDVLQAGAGSRTPSHIVGAALPEVLQQARKEYSLVVVDAPPLLGFAEPIEMARLADSVLVVARAGKTTREALRRAVSSLRVVNAPLQGVLVNGLASEPGDEYAQYRNYRRATLGALPELPRQRAV